MIELVIFKFDFVVVGINNVVFMVEFEVDNLIEEEMFVVVVFGYD